MMITWTASAWTRVRVDLGNDNEEDLNLDLGRLLFSSLKSL